MVQAGLIVAADLNGLVSTPRIAAAVAAFDDSIRL
jgi:hypothetical protein